MKILVCDDQVERGSDAIKAIKKAGQKDVEGLFESRLADALTKFFTEVATYLEGKPNTKTPPSIPALEGADVVVVDNNLSHLHTQGARLTAESILGFLRGFSSAAYFVSLNKNPGVDFDLQYLVGDYATHADLALNTEHLGIRALWTGCLDKKDGFAPSYWPALEQSGRRRRAQIRWVRERLGKSVLSELGFPESVRDTLSRHAIGAFVPEQPPDDAETTKPKRPSEVTFKDMFMNSTRSFPFADRKRIHERDGARDREIMSRVVASDLALWLRRDVLAPQDAAVTVPHLLLRMPFLLGKDAADPAKWNAAISATKPPFGMDSRMYDKHVRRHRADSKTWFDRRCFWWPELRADTELYGQFGRTDATWPKLVYCEDTSSFVVPDEKSGIAPLEFATELEGTWERRFVLKVEKLGYSPRTQFAR